MYWVKTPAWIQYLFPKMVWKIPETQKTIYFTFDDGPTPGITPLVLDFLFHYDAKATFFCNGDNAEKYPDLVDSIRKAGHMAGNHGYHHVSGLCTGTKDYAENVRKGAAVTQSHLFRPPYGRIMPWQTGSLDSGTVVVQWSVMSMDFCSKVSIDECCKNVTDHAFPGAIIVFHDTLQAADRLTIVLPRLLSFLKDQGYTFGAMNKL
jgi:peptidoglycan-N-acetylglucosamine deacetylase